MRKIVFLGGGDVAGAAARAQALAVDLSRLAADGEFDPTVLGAAPCLEAWTLDFVPSVIVRGTISGHPTVRDGAYATCETVALDVGAGWTRSFAGLYRLGRACQPGDL